MKGHKSPGILRCSRYLLIDNTNFDIDHISNLKFKYLSPIMICYLNWYLYVWDATYSDGVHCSTHHEKRCTLYNNKDGNDKIIRTYF